MQQLDGKGAQVFSPFLSTKKISETCNCLFLYRHGLRRRRRIHEGFSNGISGCRIVGHCNLVGQQLPCKTKDMPDQNKYGVMISPFTTDPLQVRKQKKKKQKGVYIVRKYYSSTTELFPYFTRHLSSMKSSRVLLSDLNASTKAYKVKIKVIEKGRPKTSSNKRVVYQSLVLQDDQGNRMRGALFGDQVDNYKDAFVYNGVYEIANAPIEPCDDRWKTDPADLSFQMTFGRQTVIQPVDEHVGPILPDYKCISQIPRVVNSNEKFDLLGIVLYVEEAPRRIMTAQKRECFVREIFVLDQSSEQPLTISAWNDLAETGCTVFTAWHEKFDVVGFTALKVATHKGFSLATTMSTTFITSPIGDMAVALQLWANVNRDLLLDTQSRILNVKCSVGGTHITNIAALLAKQVKNTLQEEKHRLQVLIPVPDFDKLNAYLGCSVCGKKTEFAAGEKFNCENCSHRGALSCPRITFQCDVSDDTATLSLIFFTVEAEKLFVAPVEDLFRIKHMDDIEAFQVLADKLQTEHIIIEVGPSGILARNGILQWELKRVVQGDSVAVTSTLTKPNEGENTSAHPEQIQLAHVSTTEPKNLSMLQPKKHSLEIAETVEGEDSADTGKETPTAQIAAPSHENIASQSKKTQLLHSAKPPSPPEQPAKETPIAVTTAPANETSSPPRKKPHLLQSVKPPATPEQTIKALATSRGSSVIRTLKLEVTINITQETTTGEQSAETAGPTVRYV